MDRSQPLSFPVLFRQYLAIALLVGMLASCSPALAPPAANPPLQPDSQPTGTPLLQTQSGRVAQTSDSTPTPAQIPTSSPSQQQTGLLPAADNQPTDAFPEFEFGTADLAIIRPGQLSRHTSPIRVIANLNTTNPIETEITLFGEDGRVLASKKLWSKPYNDPVNGNLITDLDFSLPVLAETSRLELKATDARGRVWSLNSVYLILLSRGITDRNYALENQDRILLQLPFPGQRQVSASPIFISGIVRTTQDTPLSIWLIDEAGNTVGQGQASVVLTPGSPYGQFVGEIPFQVSTATQVWMTFAIQEGRIPGFTYIKTIEFTLQPANN